MENIKYYYNYLDLPYNASEEDVIIKQKTMIKMLRVKAIKKSKPSNEEINKINQVASQVIAYIRENNSAIVEENHKESLKNEIFALILASLILFALVFMIL